jgi:hypothetical protein
MQHLLPGNGEDHPAPAFDGLQMVGPKTGTRCALEAERSVEVLAHQGMLKLSSLAQKIGKLLTALHHNGRLSPHQGNVPPAMAVFNGENIRDNSAVTWSGRSDAETFGGSPGGGNRFARERVSVSPTGQQLHTFLRSVGQKLLSAGPVAGQMISLY